MYLMMNRSKRPIYDIFFGPPSIQTATKSGDRNASDICPFVNRTSFTICSNHSSSRSISALLDEGGPSTVLGFIIFVSVDSVDGVFVCWRESHIIKKVLEFLPSFTDLYSFATIVFPPISFGVGTSKSHIAPNSINSCTRHPMSFGSLTTKFSIETTTTSSSSFTKRKKKRSCSFSTSTNTDCLFPFWMRGNLLDCESTKCFTDKILCFHIRNILTKFQKVK